MSLFNQIVPRLSRTLGRSANAENEPAPEFAVKPVYELTESADAWGLTAYLPGVTKEGLEITAEQGVVSIRGRRSWRQPEGWSSLYRESLDAPYGLTLEHDSAVDADRIHAELKDGVLRVSLPKAEAIKPRKIAVN